MITASRTQTLDVPGATLHYDIHGELHSGATVLVLAGSPMDARGFGTLTTYFTDRAVITYDPRGAERSVRTDGSTQSTPDQHADDLHRLIEALDVGPVDLFASSGGAVNGLALVAAHPAAVRTLVAHEPPLATVLPDRAAVLAVAADIYRIYQRSGFGAAMALFIALTSHEGPVPDTGIDAPDPASFGLPTEDDGTRGDVMFEQNLLTCTGYEPDVDRLRAASTRIVVAAGRESGAQVAARAAAATAELLGTELAVFPSNHGGFLGGEFGMTGEPEAFAAALRQVLDAA